MKSGEWQVEFYKVWNEKGTGKMRKKSIKKTTVFQIASKGGGNENFSEKNFVHLTLL